MCFQDFAFSKETPMFVHHSLVMKYLNQVAEKENLLPLIRFSTLVEKIEFENNVWKVSVSEGLTEEFDAVVIATGHYSVPFIPDIPGLSELNENRHIQLLHSRDYRHPDSFKDKVNQTTGNRVEILMLCRQFLLWEVDHQPMILLEKPLLSQKKSISVYEHKPNFLVKPSKETLPMCNKSVW